MHIVSVQKPGGRIPGRAWVWPGPSRSAEPGDLVLGGDSDRDRERILHRCRVQSTAALRFLAPDEEPLRSPLLPLLLAAGLPLTVQLPEPGEAPLLLIRGEPPVDLPYGEWPMLLEGVPRGWRPPQRPWMPPLIAEGDGPGRNAVVRPLAGPIGSKAVYLPGGGLGPARGGTGLHTLMGRLRGPGGCPWDQKQTHASLRRYLVEETAEVLEALDRGDMHNLEEELGDLLLQIGFHAQLAEEAGRFHLGRVMDRLNAKLVRRHPHVFGAHRVQDSGEVERQWTALKAAERGGPMRFPGDLPRALGPLARAVKVGEAAGRLGLDWPSAAGAFAKVQEEMAEIGQASTADQIREEVGDALFALVSVARHLGVDPEASLRQAVDKFAGRVAHILTEAEERGEDPASFTPAEWDSRWEKGKVGEGSRRIADE